MNEWLLVRLIRAWSNVITPKYSKIRPSSDWSVEEPKKVKALGKHWEGNPLCLMLSTEGLGWKDMECRFAGDRKQATEASIRPTRTWTPTTTVGILLEVLAQNSAQWLEVSALWNAERRTQSGVFVACQILDCTAVLFQEEHFVEIYYWGWGVQCRRTGEIVKIYCFFLES